MPGQPDDIAGRMDALRRRLHELDADDVTIVAVTKGFGAATLTAGVAAGATAIGENYAQELIAKADAIDALGSRRPQVHFIGHLQSNKVRQLVDVVDTWQTVDRPRIIDALARRDVTGDVMIQVNTTGEPQKSGCEPAAAGSLVDRARASALTVNGLMTMGPTDPDPAATGRAFAWLRRLADDLELPYCSMGMSGDFELAVAEGATHIRVGTLLFGERHRGH